MRALRLFSVLVLLPSLAGAYGGYYGDHTPKKKKLNANGAVSVLSGGGAAGSTGNASAFSAGPGHGTVSSTSTVPSGTSFGTQIRSLTDSSAPAATTAGAAAAPNLGSLLSQVGGNSAAAAAVGGAGLGGAAGAGGCPANTHAVPNLNGGQNCVPGNARQ